MSMCLERLTRKVNDNKKSGMDNIDFCLSMCLRFMRKLHVCLCIQIVSLVCFLLRSVSMLGHLNKSRSKFGFPSLFIRPIVVSQLLRRLKLEGMRGNMN